MSRNQKRAAKSKRRCSRCDGEAVLIRWRTQGLYGPIYGESKASQVPPGAETVGEGLGAIPCPACTAQRTLVRSTPAQGEYPD
jgi:hypothetical protein